ncbi:MAG: hypothetical protein IKR76_10685 [Ruminococcus sp.]|nr:hypothetical protein [Ruminococcus sp.]
MNYDQLLFSELRLVSIIPGSGEPTDDSLVKAMTVNEELINLGYTLSPKDIAALACSDSCEGFVSRVREYIGDVKADPMYPDFPNQVMAMGEATFRFHQMLHYLSTYGIESFTGQRVSKGWLPEAAKTEKTAENPALLNAKVLALIDVKDKFTAPYKKILSKTERMDDKERLMILECLKNLTPGQISSVTVTFKQNLLDVFNTIFTSQELDSDRKLASLHAVCQHTGDVWKCMDYALTRARFHFRTSQKRLIVKLLESYPIEDFKANLILSNKKGERTILMLKFIDFNSYSRSKEHKDAVASFRNGDLRSWESRAKYLVSVKSPEAIGYYSQRPGIMLRHLTYLLRNGYKADLIYKVMFEKAPQLKIQTLVSLASHFERPAEMWESDERFNEAMILSIMINQLLMRRFMACNTPIRGKKVYVDEGEFDLDQSTVRITDKSSEGGYIRSGLAYKIPADIKRIRFFIYWNDTQRVDVDLHGAAKALDGSPINVGWNSKYKTDEIVFSGDITHSDAAEYFDIDLEKAASSVNYLAANIHLYAGYETFAEIDECFVGVMAVNEIGEEVALYDPKNCFFTRYLKGKYRMLNYGYVDVQNRVIVFDGVATKNNNYSYYDQYKRNNAFSLDKYLKVLFKGQWATRVDTREEADVVLVMGKPSDKKEVSLIDNNFFMG